jgi:hypothetical protein
MEARKIDEAYAVTDDGRVWSYKTSQWLKPATTSRGYPCVRLHGKTHSVHRLVAAAFCNNADNKDCVNHINGDKSDNRAENLEWVTHSENHKHAFDTGLRLPSEKQKEVVRKQGIKNRRFTYADAEQMRKMYSEGLTQIQIASIYDTTSATVSNIVLNKTYKKEAA